MAHLLTRQMFAVTAMMTLMPAALVGACNKETKEVGVCLHVYLERDFLTLERIVYPRHRAQLRAMNNHAMAGALRQLPPLPLPDLASNTTHSRPREETRRPGNARMRGAQQRELALEGGTRGRGRRNAPEEFAVIDAYGTHGWVEGPELEDYCSRLGTVITCFEEVLVNCDSGRDFFRYRHLLHSLDRVHHYLCHTPEDRSSKFLTFLKLIECAERAREKRSSCHRPNITLNVWNQILRLEVGPELCDSLNTQRACLLDNLYLRDECEDIEKEELYKNVSGLFLGTWCRLPLYQHFFSSATSQHLHPALYLSLVFLFLLQWMLRPGCW
ncbi:hypothetical protein GWK47_018131 [Chionoecetes opilio]|uniref:Uncharacterized protein n=1 Tax=Chionoecetes opilio TaxID=41210 RepID=A0A8J4XS14_CHIOP|nr:hypothetical protein GWK47_018131 [Chionoecetes opilio]